MTMAEKFSINKAWERLFEEYNIIENVHKKGEFRISSYQINKLKEARLMAKFDQSSQLPEIFRENGLSILPITRGEYLISSFKTHEIIEYTNVKPKFVEIPDLQTINYKDLYSESSALLFAFNSGIIQDILEAPKVYFTVNGRMSSGEFDYYIYNPMCHEKKQHICVHNVQIEIDAGYESSDAFCICEAKNVYVQELLIRQLYYPYRLWKNKIEKTIVPVFIVFSNDIFHVFKCVFEDDIYYNSLKITEHRTYTFADEEIKLSEIVDLWRELAPIKEPNITFPQADSFPRIVDLLSILNDRNLTKDEVTLKYEFEERQTNYYVSACEYLGFIKRKRNLYGEVEYQLTENAKRIMSLKYKRKYMEIIKAVLSRPVFYKVFELALLKHEVPDKKQICRIMSESQLNISESTIERRANTVKSWIDWILRQGT